MIQTKRALVITLIAVVAVMAASTMSVRLVYAADSIVFGNNPLTQNPHNNFAPTGQPQQYGQGPGKSCSGDPHGQGFVYDTVTGQSLLGQCSGAP